MEILDLIGLVLRIIQETKIGIGNYDCTQIQSKNQTINPIIFVLAVLLKMVVKVQNLEQDFGC